MKKNLILSEKFHVKYLNINIFFLHLFLKYNFIFFGEQRRERKIQMPQLFTFKQAYKALISVRLFFLIPRVILSFSLLTEISSNVARLFTEKKSFIFFSGEFLRGCNNQQFYYHQLSSVSKKLQNIMYARELDVRLVLMI